MLDADLNGCSSQMKADSVNVYEMPSSNFIPQTFSGCEPLNVPFTNLSIGSLNTYTWNFNDVEFSNSENPVHIFLHSGTYDISLKAISNHGCENVITFAKLIEVYAKPNGQFIPDPPVADILEPLIEFRNLSSNAVSCYWNFGDTDTTSDWSPNHLYTDTGSYFVKLILVSSLGCTDTVNGSIRIEKAFTFYIPNSFTHNGDGINDSFRGYGVSVNNYLMDIYNRWGELIYSSDNYDKPWDGRLKNGFVQNDVYVYKIAIVDPHNVEHNYLGRVSLIK